MRRFFGCFIFIMILSGAWNVGAVEPVCRLAAMSAGYPWNEGLIINFEPDEEQCKKRFGSRWRAKCAVPLGRPGDAAHGVKLTPQASGHWEWQTPGSLVFWPENELSLKPDTVYKADISGLKKPAFVRFNNTKPECRTLPRSARLLGTRFFVDPSPQGAHRVAMSLEFNFPVADNKFDFQLNEPEGARFGKPELVWNQDRDHLNISWPVRKLPGAAGQARLTLRNFGQITLRDGDIQFHPAGPSGAVFAQNIPALSDIFQVIGMKLAAEQDSRLDRRYVLELETSLHARAEDILNMMEIRELPEFNSPEAIKPYDWTVAPAYPADVIAKSKLLRPVPLQKNDAAQSRFRFEVPVKSGRYLIVRLDNRLRSQSGAKLSRNWHGIIEAKPLNGEVGFLQPGHVLSGKGTLDIYGVGMDAIEWDVQLVREPFLALLAQASGNVFEAPLDRFGLGIDSLSRCASGTIALPSASQGQAAYAVLELGKELEKLSGSSSGIALVTLKGISGGKQKAAASRVVVATDLGILLKRSSNGALDCFVQNIGAGAPAGDVDIDILGANGQPVASAKTDARGHAVIPSLNGLSRESRPVAAVARKGGDTAWMPLEDRARELDFANFDVGGSHVDGADILVFAFSQRGIYRPGDTLYFGCMPRRADFSLLPESLPLYAELRDPRGVKIWEKSFQPGKDGIAELSWNSPDSSISGRYTFNVKNGRDGDVLGSTSARLESFQPDTLKIKVEAPVSRGWLVTGGNGAVATDIFLRNLYGTPAADHKVKARVQVSPASFRFAGFEDWTFTDPAPFIGSGNIRDVAEASTNSAGRASIRLPDDLFGVSSARVVVLAEGYDKAGGRSAGGCAAFLASPMSLVLGYRPSGALTNPDFIGKGEKAALEFMALDSSLAHAAWPDLRFSILRRNYVSNLVSDGQGGYRYDDVPQELNVRTWQADLPASGMAVNLDTDETGEFLLAVMDARGHILARIPYNVVGERLLDAGAPLACSRMRMRMDRSEYTSGDEIRVSLSLPYAATGVLSIEREGVRAWEWFEGHPGDNIATLRIPDDFEGKGHVVAAFMRSTGSDAVYMTPLAYAAIPFNANISARDMGLKLQAPKLVKPGTGLKVNISASQAGQAAVFVVDEGILQLTSFATPNPLDILLADRALDVTTLQLADLLMPEHGKLSSRLAAFGGGAEAAPFGARFQNPFRRRSEPPVAVWAGLVSVGAEPASVTIPIPAWYSGKVRVMAVGSGPDAAGSANCEVTVRGSLVMTPELPLAVAPGDIFEGTLILANTANAPMRLDLAMSTGESLAVLKALPEKAVLAPGEEAAIAFSLKANDRPGAAEILFCCRTGNEDFRRVASLSVRPSGALRTTISAGIADASMRLPQARPVYAEGASSVAIASGLPVPLAASLGKYLETYPYGCTEQLASRAFAQVVLAKWPLADVDAKARQKLLDAARNAIAARFREGMGVSLWNGGEPDLLLTAYVADYLLTLRESGLGRADDLLGRICDALRWNCSLNEPTVEAARASAYAIWVLAREGNVVTQLLEELAAAIAEKGITGFQNDIGYALMSAAMREMRLPARLDISELDLNGEGWFDSYAQYSLAMTIMARYFPGQLTQSAKNDYFDASAMMLNNNTFSTFSASQGARALLALGNAEAPGLKAASLKCLDADADAEMEITGDGAFLSARLPQCGQYALEWADGGSPLFWQVATTGYDRDNSQEPVAHGIEISSSILDMAGQPVKSLKQGDEVLVRLIVRAERGGMADCVISSLLPGGLEMAAPRKGDEKLPSGVKFLDRQEDRMLVFADLTSQPLELAYRAKVVTPGIFSLPPASAEAMYDRSAYGSSGGGKLEIARQ